MTEKELDRRILSGEYDNLKWLYLDNNSLTELPESIAKLENLERLYLMNNNFTELEKNKLKALTCENITI